MSEGLELLQYVFAGLTASWVFYGLTPYKEPKPFDRVVRALIYTAVIGLLAELIAADPARKELTNSPAFILGLSLFLGFILAVMANNNWPHKHLVRFPPKWKWTKCLWEITSQSTHENNLSYAMETRKGDLVVLVLRDGRRIYGWPDSWPDHSENDFFLLTGYEWLPNPSDDADAISAANLQKFIPRGRF